MRDILTECIHRLWFALSLIPTVYLKTHLYDDDDDDDGDDERILVFLM